MFRARQNDLDAARMLQQQTTRHLQIECDRLREELRVSEIQRTNAVAQLQVSVCLGCFFFKQRPRLSYVFVMKSCVVYLEFYNAFLHSFLLFSNTDECSKTISPALREALRPPRPQPQLRFRLRSQWWSPP